MRRTISGTVAPSALSSLMFCTTSRVKNGLGPNLTPSAFGLVDAVLLSLPADVVLKLGDEGQDSHDQLAGARAGVDDADHRPP